MIKKHTFIDLFSGCGGLSLGFEMAGFTSLLAIDNWKDALTTYAYNRETARTLCGDLSTLDPYKIKEDYNISNVDVIIGGPPCQGFSVAGKRVIEDERNCCFTSSIFSIWSKSRHISPECIISSFSFRLRKRPEKVQ